MRSMQQPIGKLHRMSYEERERVYFIRVIKISNWHTAPSTSEVSRELATANSNTPSRRRACLFIRNRRRRERPGYFGTRSKYLPLFQAPILGLSIGHRTALRAPEMIKFLNSARAPTWLDWPCVRSFIHVPLGKLTRPFVYRTRTRKNRFSEHTNLSLSLSPPVRK